MIFSNFTEETKQYLKSLRYLKDFISFDIYFKDSWGIPKKYTKNIEVLTQDNSDRPNFRLYSFVVKNEVNLVNEVENCINGVIKYNQEKEEKEKLFKHKIQELKSMFESKDVNELKRLIFEINENTTLELETKLEEEDGQESAGNGELASEGENQRQERGEEVEG